MKEREAEKFYTFERGWLFKWINVLLPPSLIQFPSSSPFCNFFLFSKWSKAAKRGPTAGLTYKWPDVGSRIFSLLRAFGFFPFSLPVPIFESKGNDTDFTSHLLVSRGFLVSFPFVHFLSLNKPMNQTQELTPEGEAIIRTNQSSSIILVHTQSSGVE